MAQMTKYSDNTVKNSSNLSDFQQTNEFR